MVHRHRTYCLLRGGARAESNTCSRSRPGGRGGALGANCATKGPRGPILARNPSEQHDRSSLLCRSNTESEPRGVSHTHRADLSRHSFKEPRRQPGVVAVYWHPSWSRPHLGPPAVPTIAQLGLLTPCPQTGWSPPPLRDVVCPEPLSRLPCVGGSRGQGWRPQILQQHMEGHGWGVCPLLRVVWLSDSGGSRGLRDLPRGGAGEGGSCTGCSGAGSTGAGEDNPLEQRERRPDQWQGSRGGRGSLTNWAPTGLSFGGRLAQRGGGVEGGGPGQGASLGRCLGQRWLWRDTLAS